MGARFSHARHPVSTLFREEVTKMRARELERLLDLLSGLSESLPLEMGSERDDIGRIRNLCCDLIEEVRKDEG